MHPRSVVRLATTAGIVLAGLSSAPAHDYKAGPLVIDHPWARATPGGATVGGGYLVVTNSGGVADRLVAVAAPDLAGRVEIHEMATTNGIMTMRALPAGLPIPPGGKIELKPGGFHVMFMDLKRPLAAGESVPAVLTFEKAGAVPVSFKVEAIGASQPKGHAH
ncbi:MAG: copper chaperone PCu(A)C [Alsobacter sp.]